jgi:hypothetical protein
VSAYDEVADWPIMNCETCARPFGQEAPYMRSCPVCFKESNGYKLLKGDLAVARLQLALETERQQKGNPNIDQELYESLQRENTSLKETVQRLQADLRSAHRSRRAPPGGSTVPPERVLQLIKLCHPDKHQNSELATEVTKWLLEMRNKP